MSNNLSQDKLRLESETTPYRGLSQFYFRNIVRGIVDVGQLRRKDIKILDFGCGLGELKNLLPGQNVVGYDIVPEFSDVDDWRTVDFDVFVANGVFCLIEPDEVDSMLVELRERNPQMEIVVGMSKQGLLNNIGKHILGLSDAHAGTTNGPKEELAILKRHCDVLRHSSVMMLADVYAMKFSQ